MGTAGVPSQSALSIENLLGGTKVLRARQRTALDWVKVIRRGLSAAAVDSLASAMRVSQAELAAALSIPERTLARRRKEGTLNSEESAKIVRLARVLWRAVETFEDLDAALGWMKSPNAALAGVTPFSLVDTDIGAESVMNTLGRIEHGVFA